MTSILRYRIRVFLACIFLVPSMVCANDWTITHVADFSNRGKSVAQPLSEGAKACIAAHNSVAPAGKRARLVTLDDGFQAAQSREHAEAAVRSGTVAFIASLGTGPTLAIADVAHQGAVPVVGAIAGATSVRASLAHEGAFAVRHLSAMGIRQIGVLHTADAFGDDGLAAVRAAAKGLGLPEPLHSSYQPAKDQDSGTAVQVLDKAQAVVMFGSSRVLYDFVRRMREQSPAVVLIAASAANMAELVEVVGESRARGVGYLRSLPSPVPRTPLGREFLQIWDKHGAGGKVGPFHLEGCLAVQVVLRAALQAGQGVTPSVLSRQLKTMPAQQFGGFNVDFRVPGNEGSGWVSIAVVDGQGKLVD